MISSAYRAGGRLLAATVAGQMLLAACLVGQAPPPPRWVLMYAGGPSKATTYPHYTVDDDMRLVAAVDESGKPTRWLTTGAILMTIYSAGGRSFATWSAGKWPAIGANWEAYADTLFAHGGVLDRLDSALAIGETALGRRSAPYQVVVMIPYPDSAEDTLSYRGWSYDLTQAGGRVQLAATFAHEVVERFAQRHDARAALSGFYWLHEEIRGSDSLVTASIAGQLHRIGLRLLWVPYFKAPGFDHWRQFGFDEAWIQPNYFFSPDVQPSQLDTAVALARRNNMGMELEFDDRLFDSPQHRHRFEPYLDALEAAQDLHGKAVVLYEGHGALIRLTKSTDERDRALYLRLVKALASDQR